MNIEIESLVGEHILSGAFCDAETSGPQVLRFTLDGTHYEAVEDPDDGYRSTLGELRTTATAPLNTFPPVAVVCEMKPDNSDSILQFLNPVTRKPIIEIGTADQGDYYPGFVGYFSPENLPK